MKPILFILSLCISISVYSQGKIPHETVSTDSISVTYGRPSTGGMTIFGNLQKFGNVWRVGADAATTITFDKAVSFGGENVAAGTYTLFVIPNETEWTIILNSQLGQWGAMSYDKFKDKDVVHVNVAVTTLGSTVDQLTIRFPATNSMIIEWDKTQVTIPVL